MTDGITPGTASHGAPGSTALETRYRRILTLLPPAYRERRGEEMLAVLLDSAGERQAWPRPAQAASLAALAVRLRTGAPGDSRRAVFCGEVLRRVALAGLLLQTLVYVTFLIALVDELIRIRSLHLGAAIFTTVWQYQDMQLVYRVSTLIFSPIVPALTAGFALLAGAGRRSGRPP
jgi:hypothetical protein